MTKAAVRGVTTPAQRRYQEMSRLVDRLALQRFRDRYGDITAQPLVVLIASYDEADNIAPVVSAVPKEVCGLATTTLVVVDGFRNGVPDDTETLAEEAGALVCICPVNRGQGAALRLGYHLARDLGARYVATLDADGQNDPAELPRLVEPLVSGQADFVLGSRRLGYYEPDSRYRAAGVYVFAGLISALLGQRITDSSNSYRAMRVEIPTTVRLEQDQYQASELLISTARNGWRVAERPTSFLKRASGTSKKGSEWLYGFRYARAIARTYWRER